MSQSANAAATMAVVEAETGEDQQFIYISPSGQWFTSSQQALQYAQNDKLRNRLNSEMQALQMESFDHNSNIHVQFTSNHEDYMHRGSHPVMQALPAYVCNMWVYGARKQSSQDPLGDYVISFDYDVDYKPSALVRTQRLQLDSEDSTAGRDAYPLPRCRSAQNEFDQIDSFQAFGAKQRHG